MRLLALEREPSLRWQEGCGRDGCRLWGRDLWLGEGLHLGLSRGDFELGGHFAVIEQLLQYFQPLVFLIILEILANFEDLLLNCGVLWIVLHKTGLEGLDLGVEQAECAGVGDFQARKGIGRQFLVWLSHFWTTMCICAILTEVTHLILLIILANLSLIIVVWYVQHLILNI